MAPDFAEKRTWPDLTRFASAGCCLARRMPLQWKCGLGAPRNGPGRADLPANTETVPVGFKPLTGPGPMGSLPGSQGTPSSLTAGFRTVTALAARPALPAWATHSGARLARALALSDRVLPCHSGTPQGRLGGFRLGSKVPSRLDNRQQQDAAFLLVSG
jgi:hypothetical protein